MLQFTFIISSAKYKLYTFSMNRVRDYRLFTSEMARSCQNCDLNCCITEISLATLALCFSVAEIVLLSGVAALT